MDDDELGERVHHLLAPLRAQVVRVTRDLGRRVSDGLEAMRRDDEPTLWGALGGLLVESLNLATRLVPQREHEQDEE